MKRYLVHIITIIIFYLMTPVQGQEINVYADPAYPAPIALAASWNPDLIAEIGSRMAEHVIASGNGLLLVPGLNIYRNPLSGRNFLSFGEDPYLSSQMAAAFVKAASTQNAGLCISNFGIDNQEWGKPDLEVKIDEYAMREIYLQPFREAILAGNVRMVLMSENRLSGIGNIIGEGFLTNILKQEWDYRDSISSMEYSFRLLALDHESLAGEHSDKNLAMEAARAGIVLLKNHGGLLPLNMDSINSIALIGPNLFLPRISGGGISRADRIKGVSPYEGIRALVGDTLEIYAVSGTSLEDDIAYYDNLDNNEGYKASYVDINMMSDAVDKAMKADVAIVFAGLSDRYESIGYDRNTLKLPVQSQLIRAVYEANHNTIVVLQSGAAVDIEDWAFDVPAIIQAWYAGTAGGAAIAEAIFGHFNPSGKLPFTWTMEKTHYPGLKGYKSPGMRSWYLEGIFVGYRYMDKHSLKARFPFGHGMSYTTFGIGKLMMQRNRDGSGWTATVEIRNMGERTGTEVLQLYVCPPHGKTERAEKELKAFRRATLLPGQKKTVSMQLPYEAFSYYDEEKNGLIVEPGFYDILIGTSATDIKLSKTIEILETHLKK